MSQTCKFALQHDIDSLTWPQEVAAGEKVVVVHWSGAPPLDRGQSVHHLVWYTPEPALGVSVGVYAHEAWLCTVTGCRSAAGLDVQMHSQQLLIP